MKNTNAMLTQKISTARLPSMQVDGNDLIARLWFMDNAIEAARSGRGSFVIEMNTYRISDHTTADDARRYRPDEEVEEAGEREPLKRLRTYLVNNSVWNDDKEVTLMAECRESVDAAVEDYLNI